VAVEAGNQEKRLHSSGRHIQHDYRSQRKISRVLGCGPAQVSVYEKFEKKTLQQYEAYAWLVHNFLETIFDLSYNRRLNKIDDDWKYLFDHFAELHLRWALNTKRPFRDEYLKYIKTKYGRS
jgi:hypothetical protein